MNTYLFLYVAYALTTISPAIGSYRYIAMTTNEQEKECISEDISSSNDGSNIGVTCCDDTGTGSRPDCNDPFTFNEAVNVCRSNGLRLCTVKQIIQEAAGGGPGCGYNKMFVWTKIACDPNEETVSVTPAPITPTEEPTASPITTDEPTTDPTKDPTPSPVYQGNIVPFGYDDAYKDDFEGNGGAWRKTYKLRGVEITIGSFGATLMMALFVIVFLFLVIFVYEIKCCIKSKYKPKGMVYDVVLQESDVSEINEEEALIEIES